MMDDEEPEGKAEEKSAASDSGPSPPKEAAKPQQNTGWGSPSSSPKDDETSKNKMNSAVTEEEIDEDQPRGRRKNLRDMEDDETEMVMMIPDLDEDESEDITLQVAAAPKAVARRVQSLQQLDHDIKYTLPSGGGLDLSFLTAALVPPAMVEEDDALWDFDSLLQQVTQEFNAAGERKAVVAKERAEADAESAERLGLDTSTADRALSEGFDRALGNKVGFGGFGSKSGLASREVKQGGRRRVEA